MGSAAEAEVAAIHMSTKEAVPARQCLEEMGHPQPAARARAGSKAAQGLASGASGGSKAESSSCSSM